MLQLGLHIRPEEGIKSSKSARDISPDKRLNDPPSKFLYSAPRNFPCDDNKAHWSAVGVLPGSVVQYTTPC